MQTHVHVRTMYIVRTCNYSTYVYIHVYVHVHVQALSGHTSITLVPAGL